MKTYFEAIIKRRWLVLAITAFAVVGGVFNMLSLPIDAVPDISPKQVMVLTQSPGLGPVEVERLVTFPVENAMATSPNLKEMRSKSRYGVSTVYLTFKDSMSIEAARREVFQRLPDAEANMPKGVGTPAMGPMATGLGEVYQFELRGPGYSPMALKRILQWTIAPPLRLVDGVADVNMAGGEMPTFEVQVDAEALRRYGVTLDQVYKSLADNNAARGGAYVDHNDQQEVIRGLGLVKGIEDLKNIVVATGANGVPILLKTLGEVVEAPKVRLGAVTHDAQGETVVGVVLMRFGENANVAVDRIKTKLEEIKQSLPRGLEIVPFYDRAELVGRTIDTVEHNFGAGAILVVVVLMLLLGNLRAGVLVAVAIPVSMLLALVGMRVFGISGNLMSLGAIDFGLLVDGSVVMIENVLRERAEHPERPALDVIRDATTGVARPIIYAIAIIALVYLPILALGDVAGKMFRPMALTVILALTSALFVTMTIMPALAGAFLSRGRIDEKETWIARIARRLYLPVLHGASRHAGWTLVVAIGLFVLSGFLATRLGGEFLPTLAEGSIVVSSDKLTGISLSTSLERVQHIEKILKTFPEVSRVVSITGTGEIPTDPSGPESTDSFVTLTSASTWKTAKTQEDLVTAMQKRLSEAMPDTLFAFSQPIQMRMEDLLQGVRGDVAISLYGRDLRILEEKGLEISRVLHGVPGAADVRPESQAGMPAMTIAVDRAAASRYGVNATEILDVVESIGGRTSGVVYGDDNSITDIVVRLDPNDRNNIERVRNLPVGRTGKRMVPLSLVASVELRRGPAQISREGLQRRFTVGVNMRGVDAQTFVAAAKKAVKEKVKLPPGYRLVWDGEFKTFEEATARLTAVVPMALVAILLLLVMMFADLRLALLIFLNVPMAAIGGVFALTARGYVFSISAAIGFIATFGIAILNGVVLTSYIVELREKGFNARDAAIRAAELRLRPVLTTALVATLGFVPMAISTTAGAEVQRPLATVVIGGLLTATLLTLIVLPTLYPYVAEFNIRNMLRRLKAGRRKPGLVYGGGLSWRHPK